MKKCHQLVTVEHKPEQGAAPGGAPFWGGAAGREETFCQVSGHLLARGLGRGKGGTHPDTKNSVIKVNNRLMQYLKKKKKKA